MVKRQSTKQELAPPEKARFPFRASWIAAGLTAGLTYSEIKTIHFCLLIQICYAAAQGKGANIRWSNMLSGERAALREALDKLNNPEPWQDPASISESESTQLWPKGALPVLDVPPPG